jgi:hypothetical protein
MTDPILTAQALLARGFELLDAKAHDYAQAGDALSNFRFTGMVLDAAVVAGVHGADLAFLALLATKIARMIALRGKGVAAKNETITDTCVDMANYAALWGALVQGE